MNSAQLRKRITIQKPTVIIQAGGAPKSDYADFLSNIWADVVFQSGAKITNNNEIFNTGVINIYIRYRSTITDDMIVLYENEKYKINYHKEIGYQEALMLSVEKINK